MDSIELKNGLANFYGTVDYFFNPLYPRMKYTEGVKFFAENAGNGAYWFLDIVGTEIHPLQATEGFIVVTLQSKNNKAVIVADDGNDNVLHQRKIEFTDCPEGAWKFYLTEDVLMLPGEC